MSRVVDLLAAEVPDVDLEGSPVVERELPPDHVDAARGVFLPKLIIGIYNLLNQRCLACPSFPDDKQLGLVQVICPRCRELSEILSDCFNALIRDLWRRDLERVIE